MKNVNMKVEGQKLIIEVDLTKEYGRSASGKTIIIASTEGNAKIAAAVPGDVNVGLNVYKYPQR